MLFKSSLKHCWCRCFGIAKFFGKFLSVVGLYTFNFKRKFFYQMFNKNSRTIRTMLFKSFKIAKSRIFINGRILIKLMFFCITNNTHRRYNFNVNLNSLTWLKYFSYGLGIYFGFGGLRAIWPCFRNIR